MMVSSFSQAMLGALLAMAAVGFLIDTASLVSLELEEEESHRNQTKTGVPVLDDQAGSWVSNWWVPPGHWTILNAEEMRRIFRRRSVVWMGDSTARRAAVNLYQILNESDLSHTHGSMSHWQVIDINKKSITEECVIHPFNASKSTIFCRRMPGGAGHLVMSSQHCLKHVGSEIEEFWHQWRGNVDLIVVALGIWECLGRTKRVCRDGSTTVFQRVDRVLSMLPLDEVEVIWRSSGYSSIEVGTEVLVDELNNYTKTRILEIAHPNLTYVDWAAAIRHRSFGQSGSRVTSLLTTALSRGWWHFR